MTVTFGREERTVESSLHSTPSSLPARTSTSSTASSGASRKDSVTRVAECVTADNMPTRVPGVPTAMTSPELRHSTGSGWPPETHSSSNPVPSGSGVIVE